MEELTLGTPFMPVLCPSPLTGLRLVMEASFFWTSRLVLYVEGCNGLGFYCPQKGMRHQHGAESFCSSGLEALPGQSHVFPYLTLQQVKAVRRVNTPLQSGLA